MKLLFVLPVYEPAVCFGGGVARSISTLCRALARLGVSVTVYTTNASGSSSPLEVPIGRAVDVGGVKVFYFPSTFGSKSMFDSRQLLRHMRNTISGFDAVYIAAWFMWLGIASAAIARKAQVPVVAGTHGGFLATARRKSFLKKELYYRLLLKRTFRDVAVFRLTSHIEQEQSRAWVDSHRCAVLPNPVDDRVFHPCPERRSIFRATHGIPETAQVLTFVGRFDWMKRVDLLMEAVAQRPCWHLVLIGDGRIGLGPNLKERSEALGIAHRVTWTGYLAGESLCEAFSASDCCALVSETENFGNVVVEAMMCGLPVLVSKQAGVWEFLEACDFVFPTDVSSASIALRMQQFEKRVPVDAQQKARIRNAAMEMFSPGTIARRFVAEIRQRCNISSGVLSEGHIGSRGAETCRREERTSVTTG